MRKLVLAAALTLSAVTASAATVAGVNIADTTTVNGQNLVLNGAGLRKKLFIKVYTGALYLPAKQANPASSSSAITVPVQIHGGFFAHEEYGPRSYAGGFRAGPAIDKHVQIGLGVDWYHRTESERAIIADTVQVGQTVQVTRELSQATSDQIPLLLFLQVSVGKGLVPYAGIAGEYQFLLLKATDNQTGQGYEANFGGLGWQAWGGLGIDFGRSRLFGEVFINAGDVERDVSDPSQIGTYRETINADGGGARFGLSYGF